MKYKYGGDGVYHTQFTNWMLEKCSKELDISVHSKPKISYQYLIYPN
jgi:hypothetical protein